MSDPLEPGAGAPPADPATPPADPGTPPPADPPAGGAPPADPPAGDPPAQQAKWWEGKALNDDQRALLTAKGLTVDDPVEALAKLSTIYKSAETKLGRPADTLLERPKDGQDIGEWKRENAELFGIPEKPDGYEIARPDDWPKDLPWDDKAEAGLREIGHKHGLGGAAVQELVAFEAQRMKAIFDDAGQRQDAATGELMSALEKDWGDQMPAKLAQARQAMAAVAEKAGLDADAQVLLGDVLGEKAGHPTVIKAFAAIGEMMGDDMLAAGGGGGDGLGTTPAEARAQLDAMTKPGHDYYELANKARQGDMQAREALKPLQAQRQRLQKIASG